MSADAHTKEVCDSSVGMTVVGPRKPSIATASRRQ